MMETGGVGRCDVGRLPAHQVEEGGGREGEGGRREGRV